MNFSKGQVPGQAWLVPINRVRWAVVVMVIPVNSKYTDSRADACPVWDGATAGSLHGYISLSILKVTFKLHKKLCVLLSVQ